MIDHSRIVDNFFAEPDGVRKMIIESPMGDHVGSDGISYKGIVELPEEVKGHLADKLKTVFNKEVNVKLLFARHTYESMTITNWAHSDNNMAQYVCLIYLSPADYPWDGTHFVKHKGMRLETHPTNQEEVALVLSDANDKSKWETTYTCPSKYNRAFILNANYLHAAAYQFGSNRINSRLVLSVFFNLQ